MIAQDDISFCRCLFNLLLLYSFLHCPSNLSVLPVAGLIIAFWGASIVVVPVMPLIVIYLGAAKAEVRRQAK